MTNSPEEQQGSEGLQPASLVPTKRPLPKKVGDFDIEKIRPELNLEKWPVWQPAHSTNKETRTISRTIASGNNKKETLEVTIGYVDKIGTLTTEDQKTYYALTKRWEDTGRSDQHTFFSLRQLAKTLKKKWGTNVIVATTQSLTRLRVIPFIWRNSYYDGNSKERIKDLKPFNILDDLRIVQKETDGTVNQAVGYFRFNQYILRNLQANHTKPLFLHTVLGFKSEIAQILYTYLELILADKKHYERRTKELFQDIGLKGKLYANPSDRKRKLEKALQELRGIRLTTGTITSAVLEKTKDGKDYKVVFNKAEQLRELPESREERAIKEPAPTQSPMSSQGEELVRRFHEIFDDTEQSYPTAKEIDQAISLIAQHGYDLAAYIVEFAHRVAPETNYKPQSFGGILHYTTRALAEYEKYKRQQEQARQIRAKEEEKERLFQEAGRQAKERTEQRLRELTDDERQELYQKSKLRLDERLPQASRRWTREAYEKMIEYFMIRELQDQLEAEDKVSSSPEG